MRKFFVIAPLALCLLASTGVGPAAGATRRVASSSFTPEARSETPEDRYAMAGGCYAVRSPDAGYVVRTPEGFGATGDSLAAAEAFHFQATDLGRYLLFGSAEDFLAASEGVIAEAVYGVTKTSVGATVGGLAMERTDAAADTVADSDANRASGRGKTVVAAAEASELADWEITETGGGFKVTLPATNQALAVNEASGLTLAPSAEGDVFLFELTNGCASFPEIEVNVDGPVSGGQTFFQEVRGFLDPHLHMMAFEFLGGRARCGRPWHPYGVTQALVDCPDHEPGGHGAILEDILTRRTPGGGHSTDGWPTFEGWPTHYSLTHEQVYYKWLERAWRGGLRMYVNLLVDNNVLCEVYPYKRNSCNEMDGVRLQAKRIHELERYIDAQSGGPGEGWFRIVTDPFEAREVINDGKLAVVLGIEVSVPLDCGLTLDMPRCDLSDIDRGLDEVYDLGVRQMELVNKFDNALSGVAGDSGDTGVVVNAGNFLETGRFWKMDTCSDPESEAHDKHQHNWHDNTGSPDELSGRDSLAGGILAAAGTSGAAPLYPQGPHCNTLGLSALGEAMIRGMAERGMIFDPDHMSALAQDQALDLVESLGYSGIVSSHGWSNNTIYPRIYKLGGVVTPYAGNSTGFMHEWHAHKPWADDRFYFGFGYGSDTNGFGSQGAPRGAGASNPVEYPFTGFGGATIHQQRSGTREPYDINTDGVAHYGLYPDWLEDVRHQAGDAFIQDMERGPEAYLQMWERAIGVPPDSCRPDVDDLSKGDLRALRKGMSPEEVVWTLGQPSSRRSTNFTYCVEGKTATLQFSEDGTLTKRKAK